jgi:hypothetical protein
MVSLSFLAIPHHMTYLYEQLTPDKFQQFCQALLATQFPNAQCLPVGQPDGGRDAFQWSMRDAEGRSEDLIVFQVKFSRDANRADQDFLKSIIESELPKVERLKKKGLSAYYLMTNVSGSAHLDVGSIDKVDDLLTQALGIPAHCWWRDDLDRRVDAQSDIKWSYPEIIRGSDLLQALFEGALGEDSRRRDNGLQAYLAAQFDDDREVKFKQVDLTHSLLDLFVDTSLQFTDSEEKNQRGLFVQRSFLGTAHYEVDDDVAAAYFFLQSAPNSPFLKAVLEGAPGQGKSTISQYICQIHRMRLLDKNLSRVPATHLEGIVRFPMRVDLRDYASWIGGKNPYAADPNATRPNEGQNSLESFLAFQISQASGGHQFSVTDLTAFAKVSHLLIVLDGFDEVADIPTREQIVKEISRASNRLSARSLQVIVTSRPAAFAKSPGFPRQDWRYLSLQSMDLAQINQYADKWMAARYLSPQEKAELIGVLQQKLDQPHMRDLARNPMQLAILLSLIQTRGLSLPDKRTALYDSYMELFFSREAEKSAVVREHRDLLVGLHQYLAWIIQTQAEEENSKGSITEEQLKALLRDYLVSQGHRASLVDDLFVGMVERVVALVSRVQGTFEFEVQPLREYFAARHLYETAPYSPPGREMRGTKPERFDVLARNFYWLNVTRFYCGCYSRGELSSLADGLVELAGSDNYKDTNYPRLLMLMLLGDWVFTQQPLTVERLVKVILEEPGFKVLLSSLGRQTSTPLIAPERCGRVELAEGCTKILSERGQRDVAAILAWSIREALPAFEVATLWTALRDKVPLSKWLYFGRLLGQLTELDDVSLRNLFSECGRHFITELALANRFEFLQSSNEPFAAALEIVFRGDGMILQGPPSPHSDISYISHFGFALDRDNYESLFKDNPRVNRAISQGLAVRESFVYRRRGNPWKFAVSEGLRGRIDGELLNRCDQFLETFARVSERKCKEWTTNLKPWSELIESGISLFGLKAVFFDLALIAAGVNSKNEPGEIGGGLTDLSIPLCERIRFARLKSGSASWWTAQFSAASNDDERYFVLTIFLYWATPRVILSLAELVSPQIDLLHAKRWGRLYGRLERTIKVERFSSDQPLKTLLEKCGLRLSVALALRLPNEIASEVAVVKLGRYRGTDRRLLRFDLEHAVPAAIANPSKWKGTLSKVRRAYKFNVSVMGPFLGRSQVKIPLSTAKIICSDALDYPLNLVEAAQAQLTKYAGSKAKPPGAVARGDRWFQ